MEGRVLHAASGRSVQLCSQLGASAVQHRRAHAAHAHAGDASDAREQSQGPACGAAERDT